MIVDFRTNWKTLNPINIMGEVEAVAEYKHLGVRLENKLDWKCNCEESFLSTPLKQKDHGFVLGP